MKRPVRIFPFALAAALLLAACQQNYSPKPTGYPRIDFPSKSYRQFDSLCPFTFKYPAYAVVVPDKSAGASECWLDITFKQFNGKIHLTYKDISSKEEFYKMSEDARTFAYKHTVKAEDIVDSPFVRRAHRVSGIYYDIAGNTASSIQFYATDSAKHYLRGALYFDTRPNKDSLAPVIQFLHTDIDTLIRSLRWK
jgi:gliding motility-associated lipoprotein GldD